ncbi:MAG: DinB family protein [Saprospiraceae bacterium]
MIFRDIFVYHLELNQKVLVEIKKHILVLPENTYPLFCHILNAHQIWNSRILKLNSFGVNDVHPFDSSVSIMLENNKNTLKIVDEFDFSETIKYTNSEGEEFCNTVQDILFHVANHTTHHRGQIIAKFRSVGIQPILSDYIFYKRKLTNDHRLL